MKSLSKEKIINHSLSETWKKWTTEQGMKSFVVEDCKIELKVGGFYELYFTTDVPEGLRGSEGCRVLSYIPEKMLSFSWNAPPTIPTIRALGSVAWVVIELEAISPQETLVKLQHLGFGEGPEWDKTYAYFDKAWDYVLSALSESANKETT